ncbi:MAG: hypothetical protein R3F11_32510 [Verrucomicrobiales bacterium]
MNAEENATRGYSEGLPLVYQADLSDMAEPVIRHFFRSKTARRGKIWSTVRMAIIFAAVSVILFKRQEASIVLVAGIIGAGVGIAFSLLTFKYFISRMMRRSMGREMAGRLPATTTFDIVGGKLVCDCLGASTAFPLSSPYEVSEDSERLEISFGKTGLCTIPLRAFSSADEKAAFIARLRRESGSAGA